ncbi:MAG TPA: hypothetical protein PK411_14570, partial [Mesotoga infera]|nr:hypothetical protein [Mesotoga infera]
VYTLLPVRTVTRGGLCVVDHNAPVLSSRNALIRDLVLVALSKDGDAGSGSGMTGRGCHPVMNLYGISFFSFVSKKR